MEGENMEFESPETKRRYHERTQRIADVIQLCVPGRAPFRFQDLDYFPCGHVIRTFLPRIFGKVSGFSLLPPLSFPVRGLPPISEIFLLPEIQSSLEAMKLSAPKARKRNRACAAFIEETNGLGFPALVGGTAPTPFDPVSDMVTSATLDNARPENMKAAVEFTKQYGVYR